MEPVPVEKWTPERRRQLTRDTLIDAAAAVFARRGFHGASLDEIAETAGFTRGAIYKNFADKEELFFAVNERFNERSLNEFAQLLGTGQELDALHVSEVAAKWREIETSDSDFFILGLEFNLYVARNPEVRERVLARRREGAQRVARFIEQQAAASDQPLPMPAEDLANIFLVTSDGFSIASLIDPELTRLYEPFLGLLVQGMIASQLAAPNAPAPQSSRSG